MVFVLLMFEGCQRVGVEFKRADAPRVTPSIAPHEPPGRSQGE